MLCSFILALTGIIIGRPKYLIASSLIIMGFSFYLIGLPGVIFNFIGFSLPLLHLFAGFFVRKGGKLIPGMALLPHGGIIIHFGIVLLKKFHLL